MISCKEATDFITKKEESKLSLWQCFQLWKHLAVCTFCRLFAKQNNILAKNTPHLHKYIEDSLSAAEKQSMVEVLSGLH